MPNATYRSEERESDKMAAISNDWLAPLKPEFAKPYYATLYKKVKEEYSTRQIFPPADDILTLLP